MLSPFGFSKVNPKPEDCLILGFHAMLPGKFHDESMLVISRLFYISSIIVLEKRSREGSGSGMKIMRAII